MKNVKDNDVILDSEDSEDRETCKKNFCKYCFCELPDTWTFCCVDCFRQFEM